MSNSATALPCLPAKRAPASRSCSMRWACCWATGSKCASCAPAPNAPNSPPASTWRTRRPSAHGWPNRSSWPTTTRCCCVASSTRRARAVRGSTAGRPRWRNSRSWVRELVAIHGQHAHQSLSEAEAQRQLVDAFGGFTTLAREVADRWRAWRAAVEKRRCRSAGGGRHRRRTRVPRRAHARTRGAGSDGIGMEPAVGGAVTPRQRRRPDRRSQRRRCGAGGCRRRSGRAPLATDAAPARGGGTRSGARARWSRCSSRRRSSSTKPRARCATTSAGSTSIPRS